MQTLEVWADAMSCWGISRLFKDYLVTCSNRLCFSSACCMYAQDIFSVQEVIFTKSMYKRSVDIVVTTFSVSVALIACAVQKLVPFQHAVLFTPGLGIPKKAFWTCAIELSTATLNRPSLSPWPIGYRVNAFTCTWIGSFATRDFSPGQAFVCPNWQSSSFVSPTNFNMGCCQTGWVFHHVTDCYRRAN